MQIHGLFKSDLCIVNVAFSSNREDTPTPVSPLELLSQLAHLKRKDTIHHLHIANIWLTRLKIDPLSMLLYNLITPPNKRLNDEVERKMSEEVSN